MRILKPMPGSLPMPERNVVADFPMNSLGANIFDMSGRRHDGVITGAVWSNGRYGRVLSFDGAGDYIVLTGSGSGGINPLELDGSFSISFLICPTLSASSYIINNYTGAGIYLGQHINIHIDPSGADVTIEAQVDDNAFPTSLLGGVLTLGRWYHIVLRRDNGLTLKLYINAIEDVSAVDVTVGSVLSDMDWTFGARASDPTGEMFTGFLDNILFFNYALSVPEITKLYREPFYRYPENRVFAVA